MRRTITYVAVWFAAGIGAVTLGSAAVSMAGNQVTGSRPSPLSADEVRAELTGDAEGTTTTSPDASATSTAPSGGSTSTTRVSPTTTTSAPSGPGGTTPTTASTTPTAPPETRTYSLEGGTATLRFEASGVTVQEATPRPGYSVEVEPTHDNGWRVRFRSADHESRVEGWWDDGPRDEVREED